MKHTRHARRTVLASGCATFLSMMAASVSARRKAPASQSPATSGLIDNVNGLSVGRDGSLERFTGLLIDGGGRVERRFTDGDARPDRLAWRLDGKGRTLIPSFVDPHARVIDTGIALMTIDLSSARSLSDAQVRIAAWLRDNPGRRWILGRGWDATTWGSVPTAHALDAATGDTPAWLLSADGRMGWANSATLRLAGLKPGSPGAVSRAERERIERVVPPLGAKDRDVALDKAQRMFIARGISTVADMGSTIDDWQAFRRAGDRGALRLRIVGYADGVAQMATIAGPAPSPWLYEGTLRLGGVQLTVPGDVAVDSTRLRNHASRAAMDGFQIAFAPDGPNAGDEALAAIAELAKTYGGDRRWRIDLGDAAALPRSPLPSGIVPVLTSRTWAGTVDAGLSRTAAATQSGESNSFALLARMANSNGGDVASALAALTSRAAYAIFADDRIGALQAGQWADFLFLDRDIGEATGDVAATRLLEHWMAGRRVWSENGQ